MTDQQHPIIPPPELVEQWYDAIDNLSTSWKQQLATRAAQWGADVELERCCEWLKLEGHEHEHTELREACRPKPPSLKKQALHSLTGLEHGVIPSPSDYDTIRKALEQLND
jgi:hypothetical protein